MVMLQTKIVTVSEGGGDEWKVRAHFHQPQHKRGERERLRLRGRFIRATHN
jgi:hypothetical protein